MRCPLYRYYLCHVAVAAAVALAIWLASYLCSHPLLFACCAAGAAVYVGREHAQWEVFHFMDWRGLWAPVLAMLALVLLAEFVVPASAAQRASWYGGAFHGRLTASGEEGKAKG